MPPNLVLIFLCLACGFLFQKLRAFPRETPQVLNAFIVHLSFPAIVLIQVPALLTETQPSWELLAPISMAWIQFVLSFLLMGALAKWQGWNRQVTGALILTAGLGNTSFVGFPLLEALLGPESLKTGIIVDQAGSFLVLSTFGVITASAFSGAVVSASQIAKRVFFFPPFMTLLLAIGIALVSPKVLLPVHPVLERIAATLTPLALVSVGYQLRLSPTLLRKYAMPLAAGLVFKLALIPAIFATCLLWILSSASLSTNVTVLESAMAPMITAAILASDSNLDSELASLMVGVGVPVSIFTVYLWSLLL